MFARQVTISKTCWWVQPRARKFKPKKKDTQQTKSPERKCWQYVNQNKDNYKFFFYGAAIDDLITDSGPANLMLLCKKSLWCWSDGETSRSYHSSDPDGSQEEKKSFWKYSSLRPSNIWVDRKWDRRRLLTNIPLNKYRERPCWETGCCLQCHRSCGDCTLLLLLQLKAITMQPGFQMHFKLIANLCIIFNRTETCFTDL